MELSITSLIRPEMLGVPEERKVSALTILIADDDPRVVKIMSLSLKSLGHEIIAIAENGEVAVTLARERHPDLVILDIDMPKLDGMDAAKQILAESNVPIIISSGRTDPETLQRARKLNIQAYLVKPFSRDQLNTAITMALAQFQSLLNAKLKIAELTEEIEVVKAVDLAVELLMEKFRIDRHEALEKLTAAARARTCSLLDASRAISATLKAPQPVVVG